MYEMKYGYFFRQEFQGKVEDFSNWMDQLRAGVGQLDEVTLDQVESALQSVHALLQEHSEKQTAFNAIYDEVKNMHCDSPDQASPVRETYTDLVTKYQVHVRTVLTTTVII
jgi:nesprin-1